MFQGVRDVANMELNGSSGSMSGVVPSLSAHIDLVGTTKEYIFPQLPLMRTHFGLKLAEISPNYVHSIVPVTF